MKRIGFMEGQVEGHSWATAASAVPTQWIDLTCMTLMVGEPTTFLLWDNSANLYGISVDRWRGITMRLSPKCNSIVCPPFQILHQTSSHSNIWRLYDEYNKLIYLSFQNNLELLPHLRQTDSLCMSGSLLWNDRFNSEVVLILPLYVLLPYNKLTVNWLM